MRLGRTYWLVRSAPKGMLFCCVTDGSAATYQAEFDKQGRDDLKTFVPDESTGIDVDWVSYDESASIPRDRLAKMMGM